MQTHAPSRSSKPAASTRKQLDAASGRRRPAIVLLEDDEALRCVSAEVLRAAGFDVLECATLLDAYVALANRIPDVVVLDRELPDGSGFDLARWMRRRASFDAVRVVAFSGRKTPRDVASAFAAGCDAFLEKPCAPAALIAKIAETRRT